MKKFYEIDVTKFGVARLAGIYFILSGPHGWGKHIDDLEMMVDGEGKIIVRGWATKRRWDTFCKWVIYNDSFDYIYSKGLI